MNERTTAIYSLFINPCLDYFALFPSKDGTADWKPVQLNPQLKFTSEEFCYGPEVMMKLTFAHSGPEDKPILYSGLPKTERPDSRPVLMDSSSPDPSLRIQAKTPPPKGIPPVGKS